MKFPKIVNFQKRGAPGNFSSDIWKSTKKTWCISEMQKKIKVNQKTFVKNE